MKKEINDFDDAYGFDEELAEGNWFTIKGISVKLAFLNSPNVEAKVQDLRNKKSEQLNRELHYEEHEEIGTEIFLNDVLLDWKVKGLECTKENKLEMIKKYPRFLEDCFSISKNNKKFQQERIEEIVKKSS